MPALFHRALIGMVLATCLLFSGLPARAEGGDDISWWEQHSMLHQASVIARRFSASAEQWKHPYARPRSKALAARASVWFTAYPASTITRPGESILKSLGDEATWKAFQDIGIQAVHLGPMERAGGVRGREFTPSIDGGFDRSGLDIDPAYGTVGEFSALSQTARRHGAMVAGDIVPGHTGKGPDFRLAERAYKDYPGIYNMIEIRAEDWGLLPPVPAGRDSINLRPDAVAKLIAKGYLVGHLERVIFYEKGVKESNWSVTDVVKGVDGKPRRWVYLHYFKDGQPTLNWLDPAFGAQRLIAGDVLNSLTTLGAEIVRLDANGFLGLERVSGSDAGWSEGHPLSVTSSDLVAMMVRKFGGFTFQELNLTLEDIRKFSEYGADLSYDFVTRPAYIHALITGDGEFLRVMLGKSREAKIDSGSLIHALQNHDEITYELVHFIAHGNEPVAFHGRTVPGKDYRLLIRKEAEDVVVRPVSYNLVTGNGICSTMTGICAASLGITDPYHMTAAQKEQVLKAHLLLALYNAMQPGVMALSGWDLVGALPVPADQVRPLLADGDNRWVNRGAYDLMGYNASAAKASSGLPRATCLWGPLPAQLKDAKSFASQLRHLLAVRRQYRIQESELVAVPAVKNTSVVVMVHKLPAGGGYEATVLNFGRAAVREVVSVPQLKGLKATQVVGYEGSGAPTVAASGDVEVQLGALEGKVLIFR